MTEQEPPLVIIGDTVCVDHGYYAARERQCGSVDKPKYKYGSEREAKESADRARKRTGAKMAHYRCRFCGFFHCGHVRRDARKGDM